MKRMTLTRYGNINNRHMISSYCLFHDKPMNYYDKILDFEKEQNRHKSHGGSILSVFLYITRIKNRRNIGYYKLSSHSYIEQRSITTGYQDINHRKKLSDYGISEE